MFCQYLSPDAPQLRYSTPAQGNLRRQRRLCDTKAAEKPVKLQRSTTTQHEEHCPGTSPCHATQPARRLYRGLDASAMPSSPAETGGKCGVWAFGNMQVFRTAKSLFPLPCAAEEIRYTQATQHRTLV